MQSTVTSGRRSREDLGEGDALRAVAVEVNLDEKDASKAIERSQDTELPPSEEEDDGGDSQKEREFLDRNRAVRKRIGRIERKFNQRLAEAEARRQREVADLRGELDTLRRGRTDVDQEAHDAEIEALEKKLEEAIEKGDTKSQAKLTTQISQKQTAFEARRQAALMHGPAERKERKETRETPERRESREDNGPTKEGKRWIGAQEWWDDDEYEIEQEAAIKIDEQLIRDEDSDPNEPSHYRKLAKRLKAKFPKLDVHDPDDEDEFDDEDEDQPRGRMRKEKQVRRRPPVPSFGDRGGDEGRGERKRSGNRINLSADQIENMVRFGMDPNNDQDVMDYARGAEETARAMRSER